MRYQFVEEYFTQKVIDQIPMPDKDIVTLYKFLGGNPVRGTDNCTDYLRLELTP